MLDRGNILSGQHAHEPVPVCGIYSAGYVDGHSRLFVRKHFTLNTVMVGTSVPNLNKVKNRSDGYSVTFPYTFCPLSGSDKLGYSYCNDWESVGLFAKWPNTMAKATTRTKEVDEKVEVKIITLSPSSRTYS